MLSQLILAVTVTIASSVVIHNYKDCGSRDGIVKSISISPCPQEPCYLKRGTNVSVTLEFTSNVGTTHVTTSVHGILGFIPIPFLGIPSDACTHHNVDHCPFVIGDQITYTNAIYVNPIYPLVRVAVKFEIKDDQHRDLVCFQFPTEIID